MRSKRKADRLVLSFLIILMVSAVTILALPLNACAESQDGWVWEEQKSGTDNFLTSVSALDANNVWAVGAAGVIRHWDGSKWSGQKSGTSENLWGVSALDAQNAWTVGTWYTVRHYDGSAWKKQDAGSYMGLYGVSALDAKNVWAVGNKERITYYQWGVPYRTVDVASILHWNGSKWTKQLEVSRTAPGALEGVSALDKNNVWAVGLGGYILHYNGSKWSAQKSGTSEHLWGVSVLDRNNVWAVGSEGTILHYNGSKWSEQDSGTSENLNAVSALDASNVWAVGNEGTVLHYNGSKWSEHDSGTSENLWGVSALDGRNVWAVGDRGTILQGSHSSPWYLAEGSTAWGYNCYITIENPNTTAVTVKLTYQTKSGEVSGPQFAMAAQSQATVNPRDTVGNTDFSTKVECTDGKTIAADRTMSWTGPGAASPEAHNSVGVTSPERTWYLAEGSSAWGFECWLLIQNPNASEATCTVTYMIEGSGPQTFTKKVPASSRATFDMSKDIGAKDASIKVEADIPVIPERAMYRNNRREGHDSIGTTTPASDYYLAEGATGYNVGYITYVLVQNPNDTPTDVTLTYMTQAGQVPGPSFQMPANSRKTIRVNDQLPPNTDVSTSTHGSQPIIAERAMYWDNGTGEACHDSIGMDQPHTSFYLPDGQTSEGRETWTLVQNPNNTDVSVEISYLTPNGQGDVTWNETIGAKSRRTFNMADKGMSGRAAIMVTSKTSGKKIMVERAMYWNSRGVGTDTIGGFSD